jgi:phosphatidylinositol 3-kinase
MKSSRSYIDLLNPQSQSQTQTQPISILSTPLQKMFDFDFKPNSLPTNIQKPKEKKIDKEAIAPRMDKNENSELANSLYIDDKITLSASPESSEFRQLYPRTNDKWVQSKLINLCQHCELEFGFLTRKHHCRACGGVFCYSCCNFYIKIPKSLLKIPESASNYKSLLSISYRKFFNAEEELVCIDCNNKIKSLEKVNILIKIFNFLDLKTLYKISVVSKDYATAAQHYMIKFRDIQHKVNEDYDWWEIQRIYELKDYLINHNIWFAILIKTIFLYTKLTGKIDRLLWLDTIIHNLSTLNDIDIDNKYKKVKCWNLLCSRRCLKRLDFDDIIVIFKYISLNIISDTNDFWNNEYNKNIILNLILLLSKRMSRKKHTIIPLITKVLSNLFSNEFINLDHKYMNLIFNILIYNNLNVTNNVNVINNDSQQIKTLSLFIYEKYYIEDTISGINDYDMGMHLFLKYMIKYIIQKFGSALINEIIKMIMTINALYVGKLDSIQLPIIYPFNTTFYIEKINKRTLLNSNTKPVLIECNIINPLLNQRKIVKFIIKKDHQMRKEQIISCLIDVLQYKINLYRLQSNIDNFDPIPTYQIIMLSKDLAIIEFIEESITLRMINDNGYTLQNYILNCNPDMKLDFIKKTFTYSLAISSACSYIIGLGDRHLDNIMINKKGQLFHIDYAYIMENPLTSLFDLPQIKVTNDIIDFLGGINSVYYAEFKILIVKIYNILRANKNILYLYLIFLCDEGLLNWTKIESKLDQKLMNNMKCKDIEITLINEIETANSITNLFADICHTYRQKLFNP